MRSIKLAYQEDNLDIDAEWANSLEFKRRTHRSATIVEASLEDIKKVLERMDVRRASDMGISFPGDKDDSKNILVMSAEKNRVYVEFRKQGGQFPVMDVTLLDSDERVQLANEMLEPVYISQTVTKEVAFDTIMYALCEIKKQRQHPIEKTEHQC